MTLAKIFKESDMINDGTSITIVIEDKASIFSGPSVKKGRWMQDHILGTIMKYGPAEVQELNYNRQKNVLKLRIAA